MNVLLTSIHEYENKVANFTIAFGAEVCDYQVSVETSLLSGLELQTFILPEEFHARIGHNATITQKMYQIARDKYHGKNISLPLSLGLLKNGT